MPTLFKALENDTCTGPSTRIPTRTALIIGCPDIGHFPSFIADSRAVQTVYIQNLAHFLLGITDGQELTDLWDTMLLTMSLYRITDIVFLGHHPCSLLENLRHQPHFPILSPTLSSALAQLKAYLDTQATPAVSQSCVCHLLALQKAAFLAHQAIQSLQQTQPLTVHTWVYDADDNAIYTFSPGDDAAIKLVKLTDMV